MPVIMIALCFSAVFLVVVNAVASSRFGNGGVCLFSFFAAIFFSFFLSPFLVVHAALTFLLAVPCLLIQARPKFVVGAALAATAASLGFAIWLPTAELHERAQLRQEFPLVSLSTRLAYETRDAASLESSPPTIALAPGVEQRLHQFENQSHGNFRRYLLNSLHEKFKDEFVRARGFGPVRMMGVRRAEIELPEPKRIPLAPKANLSYGAAMQPLAPPADAQGAEHVLPPHRDLLSLHLTGMEDFLNPEMFGYVKDRDHVAGFDSHRFTKLPKVVDRSRARTKWRIARLELISLLKHESPAAYVSNNLPQMDELEHAPTRPLDAFEQNALERLRSEEDLVIDQATNRIRMVGSLRAAKDCTQCHSVRRGELLGAFSYELTPGPPPPPTPARAVVKPQASISGLRYGPG
ncbi:MAG TPA: hypothetical protein VHC19_07045 [Pirellulales bacterium]|nr:hypothetical protein [Pirellulales bacterium]